MSFADSMRSRLRFLYFFAQNWISLAGTVLTTSSAATLVAFWFYAFVLAGSVHPYVGILVYLILPGVFLFGLILIPVGIFRHRRQLRARDEIPHVLPPLDLHAPDVLHALLWIGGLTVVNVILIGTASYSGVTYMDSTKFCGQTCHTVMQPEFTAYQNSPHSRVECVACHIGPGAGWFVRSKLSGLRQVFAVTFHTYSRPIPSPVKYLRPARETCEQCHWPERFTGDKLVIRTHFKDDEKNSRLTTILLMKIGGGHAGESGAGIHGYHMAPGTVISYISTDQKREIIPVVSYTNSSGKTTTYTSTDAVPTQAQLDAGEHRTMDCIDCHNRPTHAFEMPENAVDRRISDSLISADLPFIKKKAVELIKVDYPDRQTAESRIQTEITNFYKTNYPAIYDSKRGLVQQAANEVAAIYLRNIFPEMKVTWGTHPNNLGHNDFPGCFRCHDGSHTSPDGRTINNDCGACHTLLAVDEENPKILSDLGLK